MVRWIALTAAAAYAAAFVVWRLALLSPLVEEHWQLQVSQLLGAWAYVPLLLFLPVAALLRPKWALVALAAPAVLFLAEYGGQFLPNWRPLYADEGSRPVRVMTWNAFMGHEWDPDAVTEIRRLDPDVLVLQEVGYNMVSDLETTLADLYPHQVLRLGGGRASLSILSKHPILAQDSSAGADGCMCQQVTLDVDGRPITLINVHMWSPAIQFRYGRRGQYYRTPRLTGFDARYQDAAFGQLLKRIDAVEGPLLVLGDFNTTEPQPNYRRLSARMDNVHAAVGWGPGYTWPNSIDWWDWQVPPVIRIDHIFFSETWQPRTVHTGTLAGSDHRYVIADLSLKDVER